MCLTIATHTFNRANLLQRLYESLCMQTCRDFEWIVVDDGSTDSTDQLVHRFIEDSKIPIRYLRKPNGGKHTAINLAAKEAQGELFFIADSDDWLPDTAIANVLTEFSAIRSDNSFAGVCGLDMYADGRIVGSGLPCQTIDATPQDIRGKWGIAGDLKEIFRTDIIRQYPFPEIPGERFCPEVLVWNRIGCQYRLRYFNLPIYAVEYQPDGITGSITRARMQSPVATAMTYAEWFAIATSFRAKLRMAVNYWRFAFCPSQQRKVPISGWGRLLMPFGFVFHLKDQLSVK